MKLTSMDLYCYEGYHKLYIGKITIIHARFILSMGEVAVEIKIKDDENIRFATHKR